MLSSPVNARISVVFPDPVTPMKAMIAACESIALLTVFKYEYTEHLGLQAERENHERANIHRLLFRNVRKYHARVVLVCRQRGITPHLDHGKAESRLIDLFSVSLMHVVSRLALLKCGKSCLACWTCPFGRSRGSAGWWALFKADLMSLLAIWLKDISVASKTCTTL